jgi:hypothetical protein
LFFVGPFALLWGAVLSFVSCIPGRLGYFDAEEAGQRHLLELASTNPLMIAAA